MPIISHDQTEAFRKTYSINIPTSWLELTELLGCFQTGLYYNLFVLNLSFQLLFNAFFATKCTFLVL